MVETPNCQVENATCIVGQTVWALSSVSLVRDSDQSRPFIFKFRISLNASGQNPLQSLSLVDELTGLYNRQVSWRSPNKARSDTPQREDPQLFTLISTA
jgi:hypothetical protein